EAAGIAQAPKPASLFNILTAAAPAEMRAGQESMAGTHKAPAVRLAEHADGESGSSRAEGDLREKQGRFTRESWDGAAHMLPTYLYDETTPRLLATGKTSAYITIAEGCDHP